MALGTATVLNETEPDIRATVFTVTGRAPRRHRLAELVCRGRVTVQAVRIADSLPGRLVARLALLTHQAVDTTVPPPESHYWLPAESPAR